MKECRNCQLLRDQVAQQTEMCRMMIEEHQRECEEKIAVRETELQARSRVGKEVLAALDVIRHYMTGAGQEDQPSAPAASHPNPHFVEMMNRFVGE